jgi:ribosomal protein S27AE
MSRLICERCGLVYSRAAIAREMALATGVACGRCGGTLKAEEAHADRGRREPVRAVRAAAHGLERLASGWRAVDDDRGHPRREGSGRRE